MRRLFDFLNSPTGEAVFNPWRDRDPQHDCRADTADIRLQHLRIYLSERGGASVLLLGEALGYQGGHFSGIPMTSERLLLGHLRSKGLDPAMVLNASAQRTSLESVKPLGFTEPTATVVWGTMRETGIDPRQVVLWNAFPWHPYQPSKGLLSNRTPSDTEMAQGREALGVMLELFPAAKVVAMGRKAARLLQDIGMTAPVVRHPANGGAGLFREQFARAVRDLTGCGAVAGTNECKRVTKWRKT